MDLTVIRPLMFVDEMDVIGFKNKYNLPVVKSKCPVDGYTKRQYAKELLRQINKDHPGAKERMFHAILNGDIKRMASASDQNTLTRYDFHKIRRVRKAFPQQTLL